MTAKDILDLVVSADPSAEHYESSSNSENYTVWMELERVYVYRDDAPFESGWKFRIDRLTKIQFDPVATAIQTALMNNGLIEYSYSVSYNAQTGYIHHYFKCEGVSP